MTLSEKLLRIQYIPKKIVELEINREILTTVKAPRYDSIGEGKGSRKNNAEISMQDATDTSSEIEKLRTERELLIAQVCKEIDDVICGEDIVSVDMRVILKKHLLKGFPLKKIAASVVHRNYKTTRDLYQEGCKILKIYHTIPHDSTQFHLR